VDRKVSLFGSLLDETADDFGDVDLHVVLSDRAAEHDAAEAAVAYARASGRTFANFLNGLFWAKTEVARLLENRNGYLSIHTEDLSDVTDRMRVLDERPTT
jgi:predicted nucleotidyltransferase